MVPVLHFSWLSACCISDFHGKGDPFRLVAARERCHPLHRSVVADNKEFFTLSGAHPVFVFRGPLLCRFLVTDARFHRL